MRKLDKPTDDAGVVYNSCVSVVQNIALRKRLSSCSKNVVEAAQEFEERIETNELYLIDPLRTLGGIGSPTINELIDVYTLRMAKKNMPGKLLYNKLLSLPAHGRCPICAHRIVSNLDHYLPKTKYPLLSVAPINLIPSCLDCNKIKIANSPKSSEEETIHPYFDNIEDEMWLFARVNESMPASLSFEVKKPDNWSELLISRVQYHFVTFELNKLYISNSSSELVNIKFSLTKLYTLGGAVAVKNHLLEMAESYRNAHVNSWQTAMYLALVKSEWFCESGCRF